MRKADKYYSAGIVLIPYLQILLLTVYLMGNDSYNFYT